jgi:hypothetical protein
MEMMDEGDDDGGGKMEGNGSRCGSVQVIDRRKAGCGRLAQKK